MVSKDRQRLVRRHIISENMLPSRLVHVQVVASIELSDRRLGCGGLGLFHCRFTRAIVVQPDRQQTRALGQRLGEPAHAL